MGKLEMKNVIPHTSIPLEQDMGEGGLRTHSNTILEMSSKQLRAYLERCLVEISIIPESARCTSSLPKNHGEGPFQ